MKMHGTPCWYELSTSEGNLGAAEAFYGGVLGWTVKDAGMEGFDYHLASADGDMVAGLMVMPPEVGGMPPFWMIYFAVDDADKAAADVKAAGGARPPRARRHPGHRPLRGARRPAGRGLRHPAARADAGAGGAGERLRPAEGRATATGTS